MIQPIILAAGKGTRMGSDLPKTLFPISGKPMLAYILEALSVAGNCLPPLIVVGHKGDQIKAFVQNQLKTIEQIDLSGTGTAAKIALTEVPKEVSKVFIIYGDHPFINASSIKMIEEVHDKTEATITLGTVTVPDFSDWRQVFISFGRVLRNVKGEVQEIREYKNANETEQSVREVNPGFYCVNRAWLEATLSQIERDSVSGEYYLTDIIALALDEGKKVETISLKPEEALGINSQADVALAESLGLH